MTKQHFRVLFSQIRKYLFFLKIVRFLHMLSNKKYYKLHLILLIVIIIRNNAKNSSIAYLCIVIMSKCNVLTKHI